MSGYGPLRPGLDGQRAARAIIRYPADRAAERRPIDLWQIALPWAAVLTAAASGLVVVLRGQKTDQFQMVLAVAMGGLLMVSEVLIPWLTMWRIGPRSDQHFEADA